MPAPRRGTKARCAVSAPIRMKARNPQLSLRLESAPPSLTMRCCEGARLPYLGMEITVQLSRGCQLPEPHSGLLRSPLPPEALPRQIQDAAEAWLQREALQRFDDVARRQATRYGALALPCVLSFATRARWGEVGSKGEERC